MNKVIATVVLVVVFAALAIEPDAMAQDQPIYKWVDAEGVVHYTARPPEDVDYEEVGVEARETDQATGSEETEESDNAATTDTPPEQPEMAQSEPDPELMAERCEQASSNIENLNRYENVTVRGDDGEQRPVSDEERMNMLEEAQQFIDKWC